MTTSSCVRQPDPPGEGHSLPPCRLTARHCTPLLTGLFSLSLAQIGTGVYFWAYPSERTIELENKLYAADARLCEARAHIKKLEKEVAVAQATRQDGVSPSPTSQTQASVKGGADGGARDRRLRGQSFLLRSSRASASWARQRTSSR